MSAGEKDAFARRKGRRWAGLGVLLAGIVGLVGLWQCNGRDASAPSAPEVSTKPSAVAPKEPLDPAEAAAREAAAQGIEAQRPDVQRRYYRARIRTSRQALQTYEAWLASLKEAKEEPSKSRGAEAHADAREQRLAEVKRRLRQRKQKLAEWQRALDALPGPSEQAP